MPPLIDDLRQVERRGRELSVLTARPLQDLAQFQENNSTAIVVDIAAQLIAFENATVNARKAAYAIQAKLAQAISTASGS